ncbi:hypothetical protein M422DRAFT_42939 [Sphaerobolus stellatus SS14]|nr:hypothetical protein M422DRAFT_42939 [Sphaerobolus stellatus SS14]
MIMMNDYSLPPTPLSTTLHFKQEPGYNSQEMFNTVMWLMETSTDTEAIDSGLMWIRDTPDWFIGVESANRAINMLRTTCEVALSKLSSKRAEQCLQGISNMIALGGIQAFEKSGEVANFMAWLGECYRAVERRGKWPYMETCWRIMRLPPHQAGGTIDANAVDSGTLRILRVCIRNRIRHVPGASLSIEEYATLFSFILRNTSKIFQKKWCMIHISGIIASFLGLDVPEHVDLGQYYFV